MCDGWQEVSLGSLAKIKHGWPFKSEFFSEPLPGRPIVVNIGNFSYAGGFRFESTALKGYGGEFPKEYELSAGDIVVVMTCQTPKGEILGVPGRIPADGRRYLHNQRLGRVVIHDGALVNPGFLYWVFLWDQLKQHLFATSSGTKILHTAPVRIEAFRFALPPSAEQVEIAGLLWALEEKIQLSRRMNQTLESMARAIFRSWFVDFDPVVAKAAGRQPFGMSSDVAELFPDQFAGQIPRGWRVDPLATLAINYRSARVPSTISSETPYVGLEHMPRRCIALVDWGIAGEVASGKFEFARLDILFGKLRPYFHKVVVAPISGVCSTDILVVRPKAPQWFSYLLGHISSDEFVAHTDAGSTGTKMPRTDWREMGRYLVATPPEAVATAYNCVCSPLVKQIVANIHHSRTLAALRDTLLPKLMSGELRVRDAEKLVGTHV